MSCYTDPRRQFRDCFLVRVPKYLNGIECPDPALNEASGLITVAERDEHV